MAPIATEHAIELAGDPGQALEALHAVAEGWGAGLEEEGEGERLTLPTVAGLRRGFVSGPVTVAADGDGSRIVFRPDRSDERVHLPAVAILLVAAFGSLVVLAWPFFPHLLGVAPFGALLALGGWFLVVSRLRSSGPAEFLEAVAAELAESEA
jgi:hypothetical protein